MNPARIFKDSAYRQWVWLWLFSRFRSRYKPGIFRAFGFELEVSDFISVAYQFRDIFVEQEYKLPKLGPKPVIIDVGANVGVSLLYFCKTLVEPEIHAFEADPDIFDKLQRNVQRNAAKACIHLINAAAYVSNGTIRFLHEGADGGQISAATDVHLTRDIPSLDLLIYLQKFEHIDLLKIDIEGAEALVIPHCAPMFDRIDRIFIEYHSSPDKEQSIVSLLSLLKTSGFRLHLQSADGIRSPFAPDRHGAFDNQVNIYAYRLLV